MLEQIAGGGDARDFHEPRAVLPTDRADLHVVPFGNIAQRIDRDVPPCTDRTFDKALVLVIECAATAAVIDLLFKLFAQRLGL